MTAYDAVPSRPVGGTVRSGAGLLFLLLLIATGLSVRNQVGTVPALLTLISVDLPLSSSAFGVLMALMVACMGFGAVLAARVSSRTGDVHAVFVFLGVLSLAGASFLVATHVVLLFASCMTAGIGMGGSSALIPGLIARSGSRSNGALTGLFAASMAVGLGISAVVAFSLAELIGSWRIALALWGASACVTALLWIRLAPRALARFTPRGTATRSGTDRARLWRDPSAWRITVVVTTPLTVGVTAVAWLAPMAHERGASPAVAATFLLVFQVVQVAAMVGLPALSDRSADRRSALAAGLVVTLIGIAALVPDGLASTAAGALLLSFGVGGSSAISLVMLGETPSPSGDVAALSAMAFAVAFSFAAAGPAVLGVLHDATGTFIAGLTCLMALVAATLAAMPYLSSKPSSPDVGGVS